VVVDGKRKRRLGRGGNKYLFRKEEKLASLDTPEFERRLEIHRGDESERVLDYRGL